MKASRPIVPLLAWLAVSAILIRPSYSPCATMQDAGLDSMRVLIHSLQREIEQMQTKVTQVSKKFNLINEEIYDYKVDQKSKASPLSHLRIQAALKNSHELADSLDVINSQLRDDQTALQAAYSSAIEHLERSIHHELGVAKQKSLKKSQRKSQLRKISKLEQEKTDYSARLQTIQVNEKGWEKVVIQPDDTRRRLNLKASLLQDFLRSLEESVGALAGEMAKNRGSKQTYVELMDFYKEMDESFDNDQGIFDRSRIEELRERIASLDEEYQRLATKSNGLKQDLPILKAKTERFKRAASGRPYLK